MDPSAEIPLPMIVASQPARRPSPAEEEVVALFDQLRDRLLRYVLAFGIRVADGEEIIQDVFLALFQHLERGKPSTNLRAWTFRVAHNFALKRRQQMERHLHTGTDETEVDTTPNPEDQAVTRERHERLQAVLRALPEQDRECLCLRAEGLRYREIAEVLGISLGGVANSLARSLARLARVNER